MHAFGSVLGRVKRQGRVAHYTVDLYQLCLLPAQTHLIAEKVVFHGVLQRGVKQHLHGLSFHEAHLDDALAEATMAMYLHYDTFVASIQFGQFHSFSDLLFYGIHAFTQQTYDVVGSHLCEHVGLL